MSFNWLATTRKTIFFQKNEEFKTTFTFPNEWNSPTQYRIKYVARIPKRDTCFKRYVAVTFLSPFALKRKTAILYSECILAGHWQDNARNPSSELQDTNATLQEPARETTSFPQYLRRCILTSALVSSSVLVGAGGRRLGEKREERGILRSCSRKQD